jgi:hypothetical protein
MQKPCWKKRNPENYFCCVAGMGRGGEEFLPNFFFMLMMIDLSS